MKKIYDLVSQGVLIYSTHDKEEAYKMAEKSNKDWNIYRQRCIENNERYADNEVFVYEREAEE